MKLFIPILLLFFSGSGISLQSPGNRIIPAKSFHHDSSGVQWIAHTLQKISGDKSAYYPRMIQLNNGDVLVAYSSSGNIYLHRSLDNGSTWSQAREIVPNQDGVNMDSPEWLQLSDGKLLLFYGGRPVHAMSNRPEDGKSFDIRFISSHDNGIRWSADQILYQAGTSKQNGCWEPAAVQIPSGQVQLFFANEAPYTSSDDQEISMLVSNDSGSHFSKQTQLISYREGSRDGMPVPQYLSTTKELVLAIEDLVDGNFKPYIIRSSAGGTWTQPVYKNSKHREYALREKIDQHVYAGAPYIQQLSDGRTILSYQSTENRAGTHQLNNARMVVRVGDEHAKNFTSPTFPFTVPEKRNALWSSMEVLRNDTIAAITSTNAYSGRSAEIWMIKGVLR